MVTMSFELNIKALEQSLSRLEREQLPFAVSVALNNTATDVRDSFKRTLQRELDRPTPFTLNGTYIQRARKRRLVAEVGMKDRQAAYLEKQLRGGIRVPRRKALVVPSAQRRNKYGNMPRNTVKRLLKKRNVFSGTINSTPGLWQRYKRRGPKLLIAYSSRARYEKRLNLQRPAKITAQVKWNKHMFNAMVQALATARR
jgi:hypothetical protein